MTRIEFIEYLKDLRDDFVHNRSLWENVTLEDFLDAMIAYTEDIQGYYDNMKLDINGDEPTWDNFLTILRGASVYE